MQFQVPQFIEVEDKIFGPLTFKQFLYLLGGAGAAFVLYVYFPFYIVIIPIIALVVLSVTLAFFPYNKRPFIYLVEAAFKYASRGKLYLWQKVDRPLEREEAKKALSGPAIAIPKLSESRLSDLSWSLDVKEKVK